MKIIHLIGILDIMYCKLFVLRIVTCKYKCFLITFISYLKLYNSPELKSWSLTIICNLMPYPWNLFGRLCYLSAESVYFKLYKQSNILSIVEGQCSHLQSLLGHPVRIKFITQGKVSNFHRRVKWKWKKKLFMYFTYKVKEMIWGMDK